MGKKNKKNQDLKKSRKKKATSGTSEFGNVLTCASSSPSRILSFSTAMPVGLAGGPMKMSFALKAVTRTYDVSRLAELAMVSNVAAVRGSYT